MKKTEDSVEMRLLPSNRSLDADQSSQISNGYVVNHDNNKVEALSSKHLPKRTTNEKTTSRWVWPLYTSIAIASAFLPIIALIIWLALRSKGIHSSFTSFSSASLGGRLTQQQAKAIDVACSLLFAPALMAALNNFWFASARVAAVNERHNHEHRGIPLLTLATASSASSGSYNVMALYRLLCGKTWRLGMLAALVLLSAITKSALSNVLAYESFFENVPLASIARLRLLADRSVVLNNDPSVGSVVHLLGYDTAQQADATVQLNSLLTSLSVKNASAQLMDSAYVQANAISASMDAISTDVVTLHNVPGYRMSVDCSPYQPWVIQVNDGEAGSLATINFLNATIGDSTADLVKYTVSYPGAWTQSTKSYDLNGIYEIAAFLPDYSDVFLAFLTPNNYSRQFAASPYGDIRVTVQGILTSATATWNDGSGNASAWLHGSSYWGMTCSLQSQAGFLNYTRSSSQAWSLTASYFLENATRIPSALATWQSYFQYISRSSPLVALPGIGPAIATTATDTASYNGDHMPVIDYVQLAQNYLYASGEAQRITYEIAATNSSEYFYDVDGMVSKQFYRMTYVPAILMIGLLGLLAAAGVTVGMSVYASGTHSARTFREVDVMRLVLDAVGGLARDGRSEIHAKDDVMETVEERAKTCKVEYVKIVEDEEVTIKLRRIMGGSGK
ncbi:hypothetical protein LTR27_012549 [Elasticomyces elasticus]|nr:hypothetical protein LTR27_012549 [Elasticomyces elasticus]